MSVVVGALSNSEAVVMRALARAQDQIIQVTARYGRVSPETLRSDVQDVIAQMRVVDAVLDHTIVRES